VSVCIATCGAGAEILQGEGASEHDSGVSEAIMPDHGVVKYVVKTRGDKNEWRFHAAELLKWQSVYSVLLSTGTVRMTVEQYKTLRDLIRWHSSRFGDKRESLPGIRKIQRSLIPLLRDCGYAKSTVAVLRSRSGKDAHVRIVLPCEWALLDAATTPVFDAMFGHHVGMSEHKKPSFVFEGIEGTPIVQDRWKAIDTSHRIFVDASAHTEGRPCRMLPVFAQAGHGIEIQVMASAAADSIFGFISEGRVVDGEQPNARTVKGTIRSIWELGGSELDLEHWKGAQENVSFYKCASLKSGDTIAEVSLEVDDNQGFELCFLVYSFRRSAPGERTKQLYLVPKDGIKNGQLQAGKCTGFGVRRVQRVYTGMDSQEPVHYVPCTGVLKDGRNFVV
jgi:hypothetical protein